MKLSTAILLLTGVSAVGKLIGRIYLRSDAHLSHDFTHAQTVFISPTRYLIQPTQLETHFVEQ